MLPGQLAFPIPARDQLRKRGCLWPALHSTQYHPALVLMLCIHLCMGQDLLTSPVRARIQATVWDRGPLGWLAVSPLRMFPDGMDLSPVLSVSIFYIGIMNGGRAAELPLTDLWAITGTSPDEQETTPLAGLWEVGTEAAQGEEQ